MAIRGGDATRSGWVLALAVREGRVVCPRQGRIDLERCFACPAYRGLREGRHERLVCAADDEFDDLRRQHGA